MVNTVSNLVWHCIQVADDKYEMLKGNVVFDFGTAKASHWGGGYGLVGLLFRLSKRNF